MADKTFEYVIGNVGQDPKMIETSKGSFLGFSVARPNGFGKDAPKPDWFDIAIWDKSIIEQVKGKIYAGAKVFAIGPLRVKEAGGKTYKSVSAYRFGFAEYVVPVFEGNKTPAKPDKEDDLDF